MNEFRKAKTTYKLERIKYYFRSKHIHNIKWLVGAHARSISFVS
jgi:hypothetical protein